MVVIPLPDAPITMPMWLGVRPSAEKKTTSPALGSYSPAAWYRPLPASASLKFWQLVAQGMPTFANLTQKATKAAHQLP